MRSLEEWLQEIYKQKKTRHPDESFSLIATTIISS